jgi:hypothetical protein
MAIAARLKADLRLAREVARRPLDGAGSLDDGAAD